MKLWSIVLVIYHFSQITLAKSGLQGAPSGRITGGEEVRPHTVRYQVGLRIYSDESKADEVFCSGSLISNTTVVTAAHCLDSAKSIDVILGAHNISYQEDTQVILTTTNFTIHPDWNRTILTSNIALVYLPQPVNNGDIDWIELPTRYLRNLTLEAKTARISGWGSTSDDSAQLSDVLLRTSVEILSNRICNLYYGGRIQDSHICTSGDGGKATCSGDAGSPLEWDLFLIGVASHGVSGGCQVGWPSVHTRIVPVLDWILANSDAKIISD